MKKCGHCKQEKTFENFHKNKNNKNGLNNWCKKCDKKYYLEHINERKKYLAEHKEEINKKKKQYRLKHKEDRRIYNLKNKERISQWQKQYSFKNKERISERNKQYNNSLHGRDIYSNRIFSVSISDLLKWQNYKCAICQIKENKNKLHIDHDHKTGQVRMLLCHGCNTAVGVADNVVLLRAKAEYINTYINTP